MDENTRYMVVITGKALPGHELDQVKKRVAARFKMTAEVIARIFKDRAVAVKTNVALETARKLKAQLCQDGAECMIMKDKKNPAGSGAVQNNKAAGQKPSAPPRPSREDMIRQKAQEHFLELDGKFRAAMVQTGYERLSNLFAAFTVLALAAIIAAWILMPFVRWFMALPAMALALAGLGAPLMKGQKAFLERVMASCVNEQSQDLAFHLACLDAWLDNLGDARKANLIRKELDHIIVRNAGHLDKMMEYACILAGGNGKSGA